MKCKFCDNPCQKAGRQKNGMQKYYCKECGKYQQSAYRNKACCDNTRRMLPKLVYESVSVRGIARILNVAVNTVQASIKWAGEQVVKPPICMCQAIVEVDELRTYIGNKQNQYWIAYGMNRATGEVLDFAIGKRSKRTLRMLVNTLLLSGVRKIFTDGLNIYRSLIPTAIHDDKRYCTNRIERKNLSIRTHIKRLSRRTICFSRSYALLESCMRLYFWGVDNSAPILGYGKARGSAG